MPDNNLSIAEQVANFIEPILDDMRFELVDLEYLSKYGKWVLRIYIDKEGGVTIDDCAMVSRELGDLIDIKDIIQHEYILEVSSPGVDRPLKKEKDFTRMINKKIKVKMVNMINGRRNYIGYLKSFQNKTLYLEIDGELIPLPWLEIEKANLVYEFE